MENNRAIKIMLVQVANRNLGDAAITDTARYLIEQCMRGKKFRIFDYSITSEDLTALSYADLIVFSGGGIIKFRQEKFDLHIINILNVAQQFNIPVFFNGIGVEGYDPNDERCRNLKAALNLPCVKGISVRDDYKTLRECYITNPEIAVTSVFDPATWSAKVYPRTSFPVSQKIGLGVVREGLFEDYGHPEINRDFQLEFWKNVALELESRGYSWEIFTNGAEGDELFAHEVLAYIGHGVKIPRPAEPAQLVNTICSYEAVIACRMHTNILAHTFSVPSVGLVWNDKLAFWGEKIGHGDRFLRPQQMQPDLVVDKVIQAAAKGCRKLNIWKLSRCKRALKRFLRKNRNAINKNCRQDDYSRKLVADALGGKYLKYKNLNSVIGLEHSLGSGFRWLETDVRLSSDGKLVCVDGWNSRTFGMLGLNPDEIAGTGVAYQDFLKLTCHGTYPTTSFETVLNALLRSNGNITDVIVDLGRPTREDLETMLVQLESLVADRQNLLPHIYLRLQRTGDVERVRQSVFRWKIAFYLPKETESFKGGISDPEKAAAFCEKQGISLITLPLSRFDAQTANVFHSKKIKCCVMKLTKIGDILKALDDGADMVCSVYTDVNTMNELTG